MFILTPTAAILESGQTNPHPMTSPDYHEGTFEKLDTLSIRLRDDDGAVYFTGRMTRKALMDSPEHIAFAPLDRTSNSYGCTELQYFQGGTWETL